MTEKSSQEVKRKMIEDYLKGKIIPGHPAGEHVKNYYFASMTFNPAMEKTVDFSESKYAARESVGDTISGKDLYNNKGTETIVVVAVDGGNPNKGKDR